MRKAVLAGLAAIMALALSAGLASANRGISASPSTNTITFPRLSLEGGIGSPVTCSVTLNTTLHASVAKVADTLAGNANVTVSTGSCSNGNAGILAGRSRATGPQGPYHVTYQAFGGTLPNITSVTLRIENVTFWIELPGVATCLTNGSVDIDGTSTGGNPASGMNVSRSGIPLTGGILCIFASGSMTGEGTVATATTISLL